MGTRFRALWAAGPLITLFATIGVYLLVLIPRLIWRDKEGLWVGHEHLWSDWPLHIAMASRVAYTPPVNWVDHHPMFAGEMLRYPMFAAVVSGLLMRMGLDVPAAIILPTLIGFLLLLPGMYLLWRLLLGDPWRPVLAIFLFFLSSGPGFLLWLDDLIKKPSWENLLYPANTYARVEQYMWYDGNFLAGLLLPQRAFLPGMVWAVWLLVLLLFCFTNWDADEPGWPLLRRRLLFYGGLAAGVLPLVHTHSYLALGVCCLALTPWFAAKNKERWKEVVLLFGLPATLLGVFLFVSLLKPTTVDPGYMGISWGWMAKGKRDWILMWWRIWGAALPAAMLGGILFAREAWQTPTRWRIGFFIGVTLLFTLGNIVRFQPVQWDNSKIFLWSYLGFAGLMAVTVARLWNGESRGRIFLRFLVAIPVAVYLMGTGFLELVKLQYTKKHAALIQSAEGMAAGEAIRKTTQPNDIFLTAMDLGPWPMTWGGRPVVMGFNGWMGNFGFESGKREEDMKKMFQGGRGAMFLLKKYNVSYVLIGRREMEEFKPNVAWFETNLPVHYRSDTITVYRVP